MSALFTLREAGIPYPDMSVLKKVATLLGAGSGNVVAFNGGYLRDLILLGHTRGAQDLDASMSIINFLGLKPKEKGVEDIRDHFVLHKPHLKFMLHDMVDGRFEENQRPIVLALQREYLPFWGLDVPLGLTLARQPVNISAMLDDVDLGFTGIASDGQEIWVTQAFVHDRVSRTMTMQRCRDARDYERTQRRVARFLSEDGGRYVGWRFVVPPEFQQFAPAA